MRSELQKLIWFRNKVGDIFLITVFCRKALSVFSEGAFRVKINAGFSGDWPLC